MTNDFAKLNAQDEISRLAQVQMEEVFGEEYHAQFDNDPNPYEGTYSEE